MTTHSAKEARNKKSREEEEVGQNLKKEGGVSNIGGTFIKYGVIPSANLAVYELNSLQMTIF